MCGRLFNSILIDKLRSYADIELFKEINLMDFISNVKVTMSKYYPQNAFILNTSRNRFSFEFTPTRYRVNNEHTDTNIMMPSEKDLYELFKELGFYDLPDSIYDNFIISKLHLTKNFYTQYSVPRYINMLSNRKYQGGIKPIHNTSNSTNKSLVLSTLKKDCSEKNIVGNKVMLFYDKVQELLDKASLSDIYLREPLSLEDINILPKSAYSGNPPNLLLRNLHILRCELQYANSVKLKKISDFLFNIKNSHDLRFATLLNLLKEQKLYSTLEKFYTNELRNNVFFDEPITREVKLSKHEKLFAELIKGKSATRLLGMYKGSQKESLSRVLKKIQKTDATNSLYYELYRKIIERQIN
ncbi:MAG: hypothetical protein NC200_08260 [Candidatus Gastranaerophilales bacterium]|nr:hypothetical protein [Candidatus Gastranaerophilales bacterium]